MVGEDLARFLKEARERANLTQEAAMTALEKLHPELRRRTRNRLSQIEGGTAKSIDWAFVTGLADVYNVRQELDRLREAQPRPRAELIPFIASGRVSASLLKEGTVQVAEQIWYQREPDGVPDNHRVIGIAVIGDCLAPRIEDGDTVIVDFDASARDGDVVYLDLEDEPNIKTFRRRQTGRGGRELWVMSCNDGEQAVEPYHVRGVVLSVQKRIRRA